MSSIRDVFTGVDISSQLYDVPYAILVNSGADECFVKLLESKRLEIINHSQASKGVKPGVSWEDWHEVLFICCVASWFDLVRNLSFMFCRREVNAAMILCTEDTPLRKFWSFGFLDSEC